MTLPPLQTPNEPADGSTQTLMLTLYVAGSALNSLRALTNLRAICEAHFSGRYQLEIVDIFDDPLRALADKVLVTPTLLKQAPAPSLRIMGDLSETQVVLLALQSTTRTP